MSPTAMGDCRMICEACVGEGVLICGGYLELCPQCRGEGEIIPKSGSVVLAFEFSVAVTNRSGTSC